MSLHKVLDTAIPIPKKEILSSLKNVLGSIKFAQNNMREMQNEKPVRFLEKKFVLS